MPEDRHVGAAGPAGCHRDRPARPTAWSCRRRVAPGHRACSIGPPADGRQGQLRPTLSSPIDRRRMPEQMEVHVSLVGRRDLSGEIYRQLRRAILDGRLRPGDPLPPTRELARRLSVSRTTVTVAYDRLWGEGFVTARVGAGTFVSEHAAPARQTARRDRADGPLRPRPVWTSIPLSTAFARPAQFDFRTGLPDVSLFPFKTWRRLLMHQLRKAAMSSGSYAHPAGHRGLRAAI